MLRFKPIENAHDAERYYSKSDGGYYLNAYDLRQEWGGKGAEKLGLSGSPDFEHFRRLIHGYHPFTGEPLTAKLVDNRIPGWDATASVPKGVTTALERGDDRIREAIWASGRAAMSDVEQLATTRERKGGKSDDRVTGNLIWYATEHPETRPAKDDNMPDWDRHIHFVVFNATEDPVEQEWKAVKFRPIMDKRKYFSHRFDMRLTARLAELGYAIETKWETDPKGGKKYSTWDIEGIPEPVIDRFSRRTHEVEETEAAIIAKRKEAAKAAGDPDWEQLPDRLSKVERDKLGATSRLSKRDDLTLDDYREYWNAKIAPEEGEAIADTIAAARERAQEPIQLAGVESSVAFAIQHHFQLSSVVEVEDLEITVMERSMGRGVPEEILPEFQRQGGFTGMVKGVPLASTHEMQAIEDEVVGLVRDGRGTCRPLVPGEHAFERDFLNAEQRAAVTHILHSTDQVLGVRGKSGTGKTTSLKEAAEAIERSGKRVFAFAPNTDGVEALRKDGFEATTLANLLVNKTLHEQIRGNAVFLDEAGLVAIRDLNALLSLIQDRGARLVLLGDTFQHSPIAAGDGLRLLETSAGLSTVEITTIQRQKNEELKAAVAAFARHDVVGGLAKLDAAGSIREIESDKERYEALAELYLDKLSENQSVGVVCPTHREGDLVTAALRDAMRRDGRLGKEERPFEQLVNYNLTTAMKAEPRNYQAGDVVVFHQNAKGFKRAERVVVAAPEDASGTVMVRKRSGEITPLPLATHAERFQVFGTSSVPLSVGDTIRFTQNGSAEAGKRITTGMTKKVKEFTRKGDLVLDNDWVVKQDYGFISHGYTRTSHSKQGRTEDWTLVAEDSATGRAASREQIYVSASRAKHGVVLFTDDKAALVESVQRSSARMTATEFAGHLTGAGSGRQTRLKEYAERIIRLGMVAKAYAAQNFDDIRHKMGRIQERFAGRSRNAQDVAYER